MVNPCSRGCELLRRGVAHGGGPVQLPTKDNGLTEVIHNQAGLCFDVETDSHWAAV